MANSAAPGGLAGIAGAGPGGLAVTRDAGSWPEPLPQSELDRLKRMFSRLGPGRCNGAEEARRVGEFLSDPAYKYQLAQTHERRRLAGTVLDPGTAWRHHLHYVAGRIMRQVETKISKVDGAELRRYVYRVSLCCNRRNERGMDRGIEVRTSPDKLRADFIGVQHCGSTWHCPTCAPKIARRRVREALHAIKHHAEAGGKVLFLTLTFQHTADDAGQGRLAEQLKRFTRARSDLTGDGSYRRLLESIGYLGAIRALEMTFGELNGWHTHSHEIQFVGGDRSDAELIRIVQRARRMWARKLIAAGMAGLGLNDTAPERRKKLRDLLTRCFVVQHGSFAADYILKFGREPERWGPASELARSHLKGGRARIAELRAVAGGWRPARCDHASPWELLSDAALGDERSASLFREYGEAVHGRRQLQWSRGRNGEPGLKERFGVTELEDDQIAEEPDRRCTEFCAVLDDRRWRAVVRHRAHAEVKRLAAREGREAMLAYIDSLDGVTDQVHPPPAESRLSA